MRISLTRKIAVTGIMSAVGALLMLAEFPVPFVPGFIKLDFSELPALITSFTYGPLWGIAVCFVKNVLHLISGSTAGVGELANFLLGACFTGFAGLIYHYRKTRSGALSACLIGSLSMAVICIPVNYYVIYPLYEIVLGFQREAIVGMYSVIFPAIDNLWEALTFVNLPFTFIKGLIDSAFCFLLYKKLSPILHGKI